VVGRYDVDVVAGQWADVLGAVRRRVNR